MPRSTRCKKGTRKNQYTNECLKFNNKTMKLLSKSRIKYILNSDEKINTGLGRSKMTEEDMFEKKVVLSRLTFNKSVKMNKLKSFGEALRKSNEHEGDFGK